MKNKVFVGLSGGVDSSVAAYLLQKQGYNVTGVFIRSYNIDGCAERDAEDARRVAAHLGIPFYVFDFEKEYKEKVVEYMVDGYRAGLTPNPDVMCNREIKFGLFLEKALEMGADYIATGHYVRLTEKENVFSSTRFARPATRSLVLAEQPSNRGTTDHARSAAGVSEKHIFSLLEAKDKNKDQSYFLWTLAQEQLRHCLFPIGDYVKPEVREIARKAGLPTAEKKDSQGICFLGRVPLGDFLKEYIKPKNGPIVTTNGEKVGEHEGIFFYTVGQRHGIGVGGGEPYYIAEKNPKTNTLVVAQGNDNPALFKKEIEIADIHFINSEHSDIPWNVGMSAMARVRYRQPLAPATLCRLPAANYKLVFKKPVKFIASGQSAVFYETGWLAGLRGRALLGGGIIVKN